MMDNEPVLTGNITTFLVSLVTLLVSLNVLHLDTAQTTELTGLITVIVHFAITVWVRSQVSPVSKE